MTAFLWVAILFLLGLWLFFVVLGAMSPGETWPVTLVMGALLALYLAHALWQRGADQRGRQQADSRMRERRGF